MAELLLAHGYFLYEDPKELQIMKPYAPLGILYLCSHLRKQGFDVDVFDTTFSSREALFLHLRSEKPSVLGIYANLMTRRNVVEILKVAREAGWKTIVGGPEPGAYALEYLQAGRTSWSLARASSRWGNCSSHSVVGGGLLLGDRRHRIP
jgi:anaerobic magnesium-protoporphyrin IX monomethyl ester cyclase